MVRLEQEQVLTGILSARLAEYEAGPYKGFGEEVEKAFAAIVPDDADVSGWLTRS